MGWPWLQPCGEAASLAGQACGPLQCSWAAQKLAAQATASLPAFPVAL